MSSYLSIYIVPKRKSSDEEKKHIILASYSRSSELYQYFDTNLNIAWVGNKDVTPYTTLSKEDIACVLDDFSKDIATAQNRLIEYEKYAANKPEYIQEIIGLKEYISDLQYWKNKTSFIDDMIEGIDFYDEIEEVCCNID